MSDLFSANVKILGVTARVKFRDRLDSKLLDHREEELVNGEKKCNSRCSQAGEQGGIECELEDRQGKTSPRPGGRWEYKEGSKSRHK